MAMLDNQRVDFIDDVPFKSIKYIKTYKAYVFTHHWYVDDFPRLITKGRNPTITARFSRLAVGFGLFSLTLWLQGTWKMA